MRNIKNISEKELVIYLKSIYNKQLDIYNKFEKTGEIEQIITDFDDQDAYKYFMQYAIFKSYPNAKVKFTFFNRGKHKFPTGSKYHIQKQINMMENLEFTPEIERSFREKFSNLKGESYFDESYYGFLRSYEYDPSEVKITQNGNDINIEIEGPWLKVIFWETQIMPIITETWYMLTGQYKNMKSFESLYESHKDKYQCFITAYSNVAEFGLRRRYSKLIQEFVNAHFIWESPSRYNGTSNCMFSRKFNVKSIGTQAHEWIMFHAAKYGPELANAKSLENWVNVYRGELGVALSDTYGTDNFLKSFDTLYSKLFDGVRWDSGDYERFTDKMLDHYKSYGIDPQSKVIIYSDGINSFIKIRNIISYTKNKIKCSLGIGTWLSNDVGVTPMNIVIKMTAAKPDKMDWRYCIKISDSPGKYTYTNKKTLNRYLEDLNIN